MHGLIQLAYHSSVSSLWTPFDTSAILQVSRKNNLRLDITGILLFSEGNYLQILEGSAKPVVQLFEKIAADRRHAAVTEIYRQSVLRRDFNEWAMAFRDLGLIESNAVEPRSFLSSQFDLSSLDRHDTRQLLRLMKRIA